jgi:hypothetical protein
MDTFGSWLLNPSKTAEQYQYLRRHGIETEDNLIVPDYTSFEGSFYKLGKSLMEKKHPDVNPENLFSFYLYIQPESIEHRREVYNLLDVIGDLGGVVEVFLFIFGIVLYPISKMSFIFKATKMLFHARTSDINMFKIKNKKEQEAPLTRSLNMKR